MTPLSRADDHAAHPRERVRRVASCALASFRPPKPIGDPGILDELQIHLIPVLLGDGRRLFEHLGAERPQLELMWVREGEGGVTHLRYRVRR